MSKIEMTIEDIRMHIRRGEATTDMIQEFVAHYYERNAPAAIPKFEELPPTPAEADLVQVTMARMLLHRDKGCNGITGAIRNGRLDAVAKADAIHLRAIKLLYWFEYNEASALTPYESGICG